jgi:hypothetical protein
MDLASPENCFQARSAEECFVNLKTWRDRLGDTSINTVSSTLATICTQQCSSEVFKAFERMSVLNMFTIVAGMHFSSTSNMGF